MNGTAFASRATAAAVALVILAAGMSGCGGGGDPAASTANLPPTASMHGPARVTAGEHWAVRPVSSDPEGAPVRFEANGLAPWMTFDPSSGRLRGTPGDEHVGTWTGIEITASDGFHVVTLPPVEVTVLARHTATGWARLSWIAPTAREDGTAIGRLAGYTIYYGRHPEQLSRRIRLGNPGLSTYVIDGLDPGTWYFAMTARTRDGLESEPSTPVSKTIRG